MKLKENFINLDQVDYVEVSYEYMIISLFKIIPVSPKVEYSLVQRIHFDDSKTFNKAFNAIKKKKSFISYKSEESKGILAKLEEMNKKNDE